MKLKRSSLLRTLKKEYSIGFHGYARLTLLEIFFSIFLLFGTIGIVAVNAATNSSVDRAGQTYKMYCNGNLVGEVYTNQTFVLRGDSQNPCQYVIEMKYTNLGSVSKSKASKGYSSPIYCSNVEIGGIDGYVQSYGYGSEGNRVINGIPVNELCRIRVQAY